MGCLGNACQRVSSSHEFQAWEASRERRRAKLQARLDLAARLDSVFRQVA